MLGREFAGKRVFVTGHTGFKGSWLCLWLARLGAQVTGFALPPPTQPNLFEQAAVANDIDHVVGDVRDGEALEAALANAAPDFIFHLAAQPLVLSSYAEPAETFAVNLGGSINLMEAIRRTHIRTSVVMVTTDKVYLNREWVHAYREDDALGGFDPYSASKAAMEIAVASWRSSFFPPERLQDHGVGIATARAGNVIGGGDWSPERLLPDLIRALSRGQIPQLRNPQSVRPWQHVLEPLAGYLALATRLAGRTGEGFAQAWNFGPLPGDVRSVAGLTEAVLDRWGRPGWTEFPRNAVAHEAKSLRLAIDKSVAQLGWRPVWDFDRTVERTVGWYSQVNASVTNARTACEADLDSFCADARDLDFTM